MIFTAINDYVLDVSSSKFNPLQKIQIYPENRPPTANQAWYLYTKGVPGGFAIIFAGCVANTPSVPLCIDIPHSNATPGTAVQLYRMNGAGGTPNQHWKVQFIEHTTVCHISSALNPKLVLSVRGTKGEVHALVETDELGDNKPNQLWTPSPMPFLNWPIGAHAASK